MSDLILKDSISRERSLIIDISAVRQSYERRELERLELVRFDDSGPDLLTNKGPNAKLIEVLKTNNLKYIPEKWVQTQHKI